MLETPLIASIETTIERVEHTPMGPSNDEVPIGTEASRFMTELSEENQLWLTGEDVLHDGLSIEEQLEAHIEVVTEEDVQPSFGLAIDEGQEGSTLLDFSIVYFKGMLVGLPTLLAHLYALDRGR